MFRLRDLEEVGPVPLLGPVETIAGDKRDWYTPGMSQTGRTRGRGLATPRVQSEGTGSVKERGPGDPKWPIAPHVEYLVSGVNLTIPARGDAMRRLCAFYVRLVRDAVVVDQRVQALSVATAQ